MKKLIKIYGERNTGTTYLSYLLELNVDVRQVPGVVPAHLLMLQRVLPGQEWLRDTYFRFTFGANLGWKHAAVRPLQALRRTRLFRTEPHFITITKNPYSWLLSLYRRPYHQRRQRAPSFEVFLTTPWLTVHRDNCARALPSPVMLWNIKNQSYIQLGDLNCISITSERLLEDPAAIIDCISERFSLDRISPSFLNFDASTNALGRNTAYYRDYYLQERWRDGLSPGAVALINESVDRDLMRHFGYELLS